MIKLLSVIAVYLAYRAYRLIRPIAMLPADKKVVVISGCDTGFGNALAIQLDKLGYHVVAGCYTANGEKQLTKQCSQRLTAAHLDITKDADIQALKKVTQDKIRQLGTGARCWALVNNAGIGAGGFVDWVKVSQFATVMHVNFLAHVAMTKAFLPLLTQEPDNRIVNVASAAGHIAALGMAAYAASKHAVEGFSDSLRREMRMFRLRVCIIEPTYMATPIIKSSMAQLEKAWESAGEEVHNRWGHDFKNAYLASRARLTGRAGNPQIVVDQLVDCVRSAAPKHRYKSGLMGYVTFIFASLPTSVSDSLLALGMRGVPLPLSVLNSAAFTSGRSAVQAGFLVPSC